MGSFGPDMKGQFRGFSILITRSLSRGFVTVWGQDSASGATPLRTDDRFSAAKRLECGAMSEFEKKKMSAKRQT